ncbi:MAG TPA: hypothetical protein VGJ91_18930, partial [Polyangiaceae bacterium]
MAPAKVTSRGTRSAAVFGLRLLFGLMVLGAGLAAGCKRAAEPLPKLGQVGAFSLLDQHASAVSAETLRG